MNCLFKIGDRVKFRDEDTTIYTVYGVYSPTKVSLGLKDYPDTEADNTTDVSKLIRVTINNKGD